jgi:hypothetical protein
MKRSQCAKVKKRKPVGYLVSWRWLVCLIWSVFGKLVGNKAGEMVSNFDCISRDL